MPIAPSTAHAPGQANRPPAYDPSRFKPRTFFDAVPAFQRGQDDPRHYLERCLEVIAAREPTVQAWVIVNERGARDAADASARRWREGRPLSPIDGMPIGIKDLIETKDMPTQMGCAAYAGHFPKADSASVRALRDAGAIILGKLVTAELAAGLPGPTTNPFNPLHTPGSSSSGPAAAVGAGMIPVAIGTQVGGSVIRPASYCANWALKPTLGALNRGERLTYSHGTLGIHGGSPQDLWPVANAISLRAGGDPGRPGLFGPPDTPAAAKPRRLIVMETGGWADLDGITREAFEQILADVQKAGVEIVRRSESALLDVFEQRIAAMNAIGNDITAFELRPLLENLVEQQPGKISPRLMQKLEQGRKLTLDHYRARLLACEEARHRFAAIAPLGDAFISVASSGPAPLGAAASTHPAATTVFNAPPSMLGAPAISIPLMAIDGLPVGVQLMGQQHADAQVIGIARWLGENVAPVVRNP